MTFNDFKKKLSAPMIWGNLLAMAIVMIAIIVGLWQGLAVYTLHGQKVVVPQVCGMTEADAEYALNHAGLEVIVSDTGYNRSLAPGTILEQFPVAESEVKPGRRVYLTINSGNSPTLTMPDIADNCSVREAQARLRALGFKLGPIEYVEGDKDWVINVKCRGRVVYVGEKIPIDAPVVLVVGSSESEGEDWSVDSLEVSNDDWDGDIEM